MKHVHFIFIPMRTVHAQIYLTAIVSISTSAPIGRALTAKAARAGYLFSIIPAINLVHGFKISNIGKEDRSI